MHSTMKALALALLAVSAVAAPAVAQFVIPSAAIQKALAVVPTTKLLGVRIVDQDSLTIILQDSAVKSVATSKEILGAGKLQPGKAASSPKEAGREVAAVLWKEWAEQAGIKHVVVEVRGVDAKAELTKLRFFYYPADLARK